ncbi:T9SS type A sorting domain-containing protein [bacterium BMS3Abin03]|nr:T9SS type A sorting domain-containing protein [bacterium BMS3Abin03]
MKNIFIISIFLRVFIFPGILIAQNLTNQEKLEFYPYNVGNKWSYLWVYYNADYDYYEAGTDVLTISKDTVLNSKKYWVVEYYGNYNYEYYSERIDTTTGDVIRIDVSTNEELSIVDNVYADVGDTIAISNNRYLLYCDKIVIQSLRDTIINNFQTTIREVVGLPSKLKLYFARNIGMLGSGKNFWIDSANVNGITFSDIPSDFTDIVEDNEPVGTNYILLQNYPNPFNLTTTITYSLPKSSLVTLKIYDILGKEIGTLVNDEKQSGTYKVTWDAQSIPSGIYFYKITAGEYSKTIKMILLK